MGRTVTDLTREEIEAYQAALRRREAAGEEAARRRAERAWTVAGEAARVLKKEFGARRVWVFGSLPRGTFGAASDVDLAVEGLGEQDYFRAVGLLLGLDPEIPVDLVDLRTARPTLRRSIRAEGVSL